jgi:hypothetical protein
MELTAIALEIAFALIAQDRDRKSHFKCFLISFHNRSMGLTCGQYGG